MATEIDPKDFGAHIRSLRKARGRTQVQLAKASKLSADTIRRIEHGSMSASLETIGKLATGLALPVSTLFESHELGDVDARKVLISVLAGRSSKEVQLILRVALLIIEERDS